MRIVFSKALLLAVCGMFTCFGVLTADARQVNVSGYYRRNGTYVAPHVRNVSDTPKSFSGPSYAPRSYSTPSYRDTSYSASYYPRRSYRNPSERATTYQSSQTQGSRKFSKAMKEQKYQEQGGICPHCGRHCDYDQMEGDHIVPYSKGGETIYSNLQMLCAPCNRSKGNRYSR